MTFYFRNYKPKISCDSESKSNVIILNAGLPKLQTWTTSHPIRLQLNNIPFSKYVKSHRLPYMLAARYHYTTCWTETSWYLAAQKEIQHNNFYSVIFHFRNMKIYQKHIRISIHLMMASDLQIFGFSNNKQRWLY